MAPVYNILRTCGLIVCLVLHVYGVPTHPESWIVSVQINEKTCGDTNCKYLLVLRGSENLDHGSWRITPKEGARGSECEVFSPNYEILDIEYASTESKIELFLPKDEGKVFFCKHSSDQKSSPVGASWIHQGPNIFLNPNNVKVSKYTEKESA